MEACNYGTFLVFWRQKLCPNVIQRLTKIFLIAHEKGLSFQSIFQEFDSDGDGMLSATELVAALEVPLSTFEPITVEDAEEVIVHLHPDQTGAKRNQPQTIPVVFRGTLGRKQGRVRRTG